MTLYEIKAELEQRLFSFELAREAGIPTIDIASAEEIVRNNLLQALDCIEHAIDAEQSAQRIRVRLAARGVS